MQHTATHCNTLQHTAIRGNTLHHTATHSTIISGLLAYPAAFVRAHLTPTVEFVTFNLRICNTLQHTDNTLQHTATDGIARHRTATRCCNTLQHTATHSTTISDLILAYPADFVRVHLVSTVEGVTFTLRICNTLQHTATHCKINCGLSLENPAAFVRIHLNTSDFATFT